MSPNTTYRNGRPTNIHASLESALRSLRLPEESRRLWADAICINQDDKVERSQQVKVMTDVYKQASRVIVWLGPKGDRTADAFRLAQVLHRIRRDLHYDRGDLKRLQSPASGGLSLELICRQLTPGSADHQLANPDSKSNAWAALADLLDREWWQRIWCVQELAVANACVARCGDLERPFVYLLASAAPISHFKNSYTDEGTLWFWNRIYLGKAIEKPDSPHHISFFNGAGFFMNLLQDTKPFKSKERADRIFALRGLATELVKPSLVPNGVFYTRKSPSVRTEAADFLSNKLFRTKQSLSHIIYNALNVNYAKPERFLFRDVTRHLILSYQNLHMLSHVRHPQEGIEKRPEGYPSWVADFREVEEGEIAPSPFGPVSWFYTGRVDGFRNFLGTDHQTRLYRRKEDEDVLSLDGLCVGRVSKISRIVEADKNGTLMLDGIWNDIYGQPLLPLDARNIPVLEDLGTCVLAGLPIGQPYKNGDKYTAGCVTIESQIHVRKLFDQGVALLYAHMRAVHGISLPLNRPGLRRTPDPNEPDEVKFQLQAKKFTFGRRIYRTETGRLGLGPAAMREGDEICVLIGGSVPFVIRSRKPEGWFLVGETYLHDLGIMLGQVADKAVHSLLRTGLQVFDFY